MSNSSPPTRFPYGLVNNARYQPFGNSGMPDPIFYHNFWDDFDDTIPEAATQMGQWIITQSASSTCAGTAGDGGLALFSPFTGSTDYTYIQPKVAGFTFTSGQKMFFGCRFFITAGGSSTISVPTFWAGIFQHQAAGTPAPTDGIYFVKAAASPSLQLVVNQSSTPISVGPLTAALVSGTSYDIGFEIDTKGVIKGYFGTQLFGWVPQLATGSVNAQGVPNLPIVGPYCTGSTLGPTSTTTGTVIYPTAALAPTLAFLSGDTHQGTMTSDFIVVQKER